MPKVHETPNRRTHSKNSVAFSTDVSEVEMVKDPFEMDQFPTTPKGTNANGSNMPQSSPPGSVESTRKRLSSISTSQPNIAITSLTPPKVMKSYNDHNRVYSASAAGTSNGPSYKKWKARPGTLIANTLMAAGCDHVITMDLHDPQFQGITLT